MVQALVFLCKPCIIQSEEKMWGGIVKQRIKALLFVLVIFVAVSSCGWENEITEVQSSETTTLTAEDQIRIVIPSDEEVPYREDWKFWQYLTEFSGADIQVEAYASKDYETAISLMLSDPKTRPDLLYLQNVRSLEPKQYSALVSLDRLLSRMPNYTAALDALAQQDLRDALTLERCYWEGKLYAPIQLGRIELDTAGWLCRKDVLDRHGLTLPQTMEELYAVCRELKRLYPNSYPLVIQGRAEVFTLLAPAFQAHLDYGIYYDFQTDAWQSCVDQPGMKELLTLLLKMKEEGLAHPMTGNLKESDYEKLMAEKTVFFTVDHLSKQAEYGMSAMVPPRADGECGQHKVGRLETEMPGYLVCDTENETRIFNAIRLLDLMYTQEARTLLSWGKEGETFTVDAAGNKHWILGEGETAQTKYGFATAGLLQYLDEDAYNTFVTDGNPVDCRLSVYTEWKLNPARWLVCNDAEAETLEEYAPELLNLFGDTVQRILSGAQPFSAWETLAETFEESGASRVIMAYENAWKRLQN